MVDLENGFLVGPATVGAFVAVQFNDAGAEFFPFAFVVVLYHRGVLYFYDFKFGYLERWIFGSNLVKGVDIAD
ncbi:MAG: hypothetical protein SFU25_06900 [Candidatus Caenarcaniphilales bacterium]|nr:hypothetical protein [Candidatus Caenarcaniphilales bacterium]